MCRLVAKCRVSDQEEVASHWGGREVDYYKIIGQLELGN